MILDSLETTTAAEFAAGTGWAIEPQGACRGDVCVPLDRSAELDVRATASRLRMALVTDEATGLSALGPATLGDRALHTADSPDLLLGDLAVEPFALSSLHGRKVLLVAWAPY